MILTDKTILIAGASSVIGRSVALQLAKRNNRLIIFARRKESLESLAVDIRSAGSQALVVAGDALSKEQAEAAVDRATQTFGAIDAALLNVGDGPAFNMSKCSVDDVLGNMDLNFGTMVNFLVPLMSEMKEQGRGGVIAHTNSLGGSLDYPCKGLILRPKRLVGY